EVALFPFVLTTLSSSVILTVTDEFARQLGQSSKAGLVPRDYILITGDSYAEGLGDTLAEVGPHSRQDYASAHVIAEQLGRDVVNVGRRGWGNTNASLAPAMFVARGRMSLLYPVAPPVALFYYFYEVNDFDDNLRWARLGYGVDLGVRPYTLAD